MQPVAQQPVQWKTDASSITVSMGTFRKAVKRQYLYREKRRHTFLYRLDYGNDFRDLAQRNNIQAPYALKLVRPCRWVMLPVRQSLAEMHYPGRRSRARSCDQACTKFHVAVASQPTITYSESSGEQSATKCCRTTSQLRPRSQRL